VGAERCAGEDPLRLQESVVSLGRSDHS